MYMIIVSFYRFHYIYTWAIALLLAERYFHDLWGNNKQYSHVRYFIQLLIQGINWHYIVRLKRDNLTL